MKGGTTGWVSGVALAALLGATSLAAQERTFEWSGRLDAGNALEVKGISGHVRATLAPGRTVEVVAEKRGRSSDFEDVTIHVFEHRDGVTVCAVYFGHGLEGDPCDYDDDRPRRNRRWNRSIDVDVDFEVRVPAGAVFTATMVSGDVEAVGLRSVVEATTVNGDIEISTSEYAKAKTVNGSIDVQMTGDDWDDLEFVTVSGDITVEIPSGVGAEVEFESLSGDFRSDFALESERRRDRFVGSRVEGIIGDGSRYLTFSTVSGDVRLRRRG